jgi:hypothetical protein
MVRWYPCARGKLSNGQHPEDVLDCAVGHPANLSDTPHLQLLQPQSAMAYAAATISKGIGPRLVPSALVSYILGPEFAKKMPESNKCGQDRLKASMMDLFADYAW